MTHRLAYLRSEAVRLLQQHDELHKEFQALRLAGFPAEESASLRKRLQTYRALVANHCLALEWTFYPPCGRSRADWMEVFR